MQEIPLQPGRRYLIRFQYRNTLQDGEQRVYLQVLDRTGAVVNTFPTGDGYHAITGSDWKAGVFVAEAGKSGEKGVLWLRNRGSELEDEYALIRRNVPMAWPAVVPGQQYQTDLRWDAS